MAFLSEPAPQHLVAIDIAPGVRRMVAPNAGPMTYHGTNSWVVEAAGGLWVIDPGPDDAPHVAALAGLGPIAGIVLTHTHPDHVGGAAGLQRLTGAPVYGFHTPWAKNFAPDIKLADGDAAGPFTAIYTPGHASDHLCFALNGKILFTGDHVMSWSTSMVSPPDGNMAAYMAGLRLLLARGEDLYLCGHGPPLPQPAPLVRAMLSHRAGREASILAALEAGPADVDGLLALMYRDVAAHLLGAARRTVVAHVEKLVAEGRVLQAESGSLTKKAGVP